MIPAQKANRERFKKVVAEAKKLRKKNPKLTQAQAVKQAWAITYSKGTKVGAAKKAAPKKAAKKAAAKKAAPKKSAKKAAPKKMAKHIDTKSHNVNIRVVSGIGSLTSKAKELLKDKYGKLASKKLIEKTKRGKKSIQKEMTAIAAKIRKIQSI